MNRLQNKVALITGGASGIGLATCRLFAEEGARVALVDIDEAAGRAAVESIVAAGGQAKFFACDISQEERVQAAVTAVAAAWGTINILVNNAAVFVLSGIEATVEQWRRTLDVNVMGTALVSKHVVPVMRHGGGAIVNLGSISSFIAQPEFVTYNVTKAAISQMTRCMALDLAPDRIRVNAVCPGTVWTPIVESLSSAEGLDRATTDTDPAWGGACMLNRLAEPREIAQAILFLASDEASYITAENLMVDGGYVAK